MYVRLCVYVYLLPRLFLRPALFCIFGCAETQTGRESEKERQTDSGTQSRPSFFWGACLLSFSVGYVHEDSVGELSLPLEAPVDEARGREGDARALDGRRCQHTPRREEEEDGQHKHTKTDKSFGRKR